MGEIIFYCELG